MFDGKCCSQHYGTRRYQVFNKGQDYLRQVFSLHKLNNHFCIYSLSSIKVSILNDITMLMTKTKNKINLVGIKYFYNTEDVQNLQNLWQIWSKMSDLTLVVHWHWKMFWLLCCPPLHNRGFLRFTWFLCCFPGRAIQPACRGHQGKDKFQLWSLFGK